MPNYRKYINPLIEELSTISDFAKVQKNTQILKEEYPHLERTAKVLSAEISHEEKKLEDLNEQLEDVIEEIESATGDDKHDAVNIYNQLFSKLEEDIQKINHKLGIINSPYFGKVVFNRHRTNDYPSKQITAYIGKFGVFDKENQNILVTDWRAPIANLYYQNSGPSKNVEFQSPTTIQKGDLEQKRQFEINRARINQVHDAKTGNVSADEFLIAQLESRIGSKLSDIVATIQKQQNEIIREDIDKTVIIQGVAGSGKTTILLHKIAYILFAHRDKIDPKNSIIIAPNQMFLDYISDVLPSLGIENLESNTFLFWARKILEWTDNYIVSTKDDDLEIKAYKGSYDFKLLLEEYFKTFEEDLLENIPNTLKYDITEKYYELKQKHPKISMKERLELSVNYAVTQKQFRRNLQNGYVAPVQGMEQKANDIKEYLKKKFNVYKIYKNMFDHIEESSHIKPQMLQKLKEYNKKTLYSEKGYLHYKMEDLPAMLWLHFQLYGYGDYIKDYILVDEAQDLSPFQMLILRQVAKDGNLTIAGDIAQAINPPFHIKNWTEIISIFERDNPNSQDTAFHQLHRCYRTTVEIIEFINQIFKKHFPKEIKLPEAVLRHGEKVEYIETNKQDDMSPMIEIINREFAKDISTLAIICKNLEHANQVYRKLREKQSKIQRNILSHDENNYESGLLVLPIEKAKGLEFDTVIIADMTEENYKIDFLDIKLLYVAVTRALHKLYIHIPTYTKKSRLIES